MEYDVQLELRKFVAPEFIYGSDARLLVGRYARKLGGRRVLLVSDPGVAAAGWTGEVAARLEEAGLTVERFLDVSPNPRDGEVLAGAKAFRAGACDILVAVGGGSPIDCAKGIGILAANPGSIIDFQGVDQVPAPMPPLICIPTTAGTSADVSQFAIISHVAERVKIAIISKAVVPDVALIDPKTLVTMDPYLTACTGMDALVHAIEAFASNAHSPVTDLHALEAIRLIQENLRASCGAPADLELRGRVMLASLHAGLAFSNASLGCVHAMAHSLGGFLDLPHGECNALLLAQVLEFNFPAAPERFRRIAQALDCPLDGLDEGAARARLVLHVRELGQACGIAPGLGRRGVRSADLPRLADKAIQDPCNATNPRLPGRDDLLALFSEAM
jgi:alcohol dehydrogenase class IV